MQHRERRRTQPTETREEVEIAHDGNDPVGTQARNVLGAACKTVKADLRMEQVGGAQRDIATANQQYPDHEIGSNVRASARKTISIV